MIATGVGYTGGTSPDPTYAQVCGGGTGHAEAIRVRFDPSVVSYEKLLRAFLKEHNPRGERNGSRSQYRVGVFTHNSEQARVAQLVSLEIEAETGRPLGVGIDPLGPFYLAEEYHQRYYEDR